MIVQEEPLAKIEQQENVVSLYKQPEGFTCDTIKTGTYKHQLFCWIEQTKKVIQFYQNYPCFVNKYTTFNNWSPAMMAVRHGNYDLLNYFVKNNHELDTTNVYHNTMVHGACYAHNHDMLIYLLKQLKRTPNPPNSEPSPLKFSIKFNDHKLLEILACYGAYYIFDEVYNNVRKETNPEKKDQVVYYALDTKKQIPSSMIVKDIELKQFPIKESLRWVRAKNFMIVKKGVENSNNPKTAPINRIFQNDIYMESILKYCVGSGRHLSVVQNDAQVASNANN